LPILYRNFAFEIKSPMNVQRVKRNNFNSDDVSAADINQLLVKIASAVDDVAQLELREEEVTPTTVRDELKRILNEEKSTMICLPGLNCF